MAERDVTVAEAAASLGVSTDTVKRMIRRGALPGHKDAAGRWRVTIDTPPGAPLMLYPENVGADEATDTAAVDLAEVERLRTELAHAREIAGDLRSRVAAQERQIEDASVERAELRRLLSAAMQGTRALPAPAAQEPDTATIVTRGTRPASSPAQGRPRPSLWRRLLAALTDAP